MAKNKPVGIMIDKNTEVKKVLIGFDRKIDFLEFTPPQAIEFAEAVLKKTMELAPKSNIILPSQMN